MEYQHTAQGIFLSRPNRFIAHVMIDGREEVCHVKNTGRCRELLVPGARLVLEYHPEAAEKGRKTRYDVIGVYKEHGGARDETLLINMDSQAPNTAAWEWVQNGGLARWMAQEGDAAANCGPAVGPGNAKDRPAASLDTARTSLVTQSGTTKACPAIPETAPCAGLAGLFRASGTTLAKTHCRQPAITQLRREVACGASRFDLAFLLDGEPSFMEVKGVTLERQGIAAFPDAPTERGVKHVDELTALARKGVPCFLLLVIQMKGVVGFRPNWETHPKFGHALERAKKAGVRILAYDCLVTEGSMQIHAPIPIIL